MLNRYLATLAVLLAPAVAFAQVGPPARPPAGNIDERVRQQIATPSERDREDALMTGDTDLLLLRQTPLFTLHGGLTVSPTSNAFLSPTARRSDNIFQLDAGLRIGTRIAGKIDIFAGAGVVGVRYAEFKALDYNALTGNVGIAARFKPVDITLSYQPSIVYTPDFDTRQLTQHRLRATVALPFNLAGFRIEPSASVERVLSTPADYRNWAYSGEFSVSRPLSRRMPIFGYASIGYERRDYDSYFFDFVGVQRNDDLVRATVGIVWRPRAWADIRIAYSFGDNRSTSDVNGYVSHTGSLGLAAALRF